MKVEKIDSKIRGWFVGDFERAILRTKDCEVAYQTYKKGEHHKKHVHKIAQEVSLFIRGRAIMNGKEYGEGDILLIEPGEAVDFDALTDVETVVVKVPSVMGDKYELEE